MILKTMVVLLAAVNWRPAAETAAEAAASAWQLTSDQLEREQSAPLASPAFNGRLAAHIYNGRPYSGAAGGDLGAIDDQRNLFRCVEPSQYLFERFSIQYNRSFNRGGSNLAERQQLFDTTLRRTIMLNKIIQNEILNGSNYYRKPKIGNYHFVSPMGEDNFALWYADITDCELGLIKKILFDIFDLIDQNELKIAYQVAREKSRFLPLFDEEAFEQMANILLVRLYDRFEGDKKMFQLFQWPSYMRKLAAYAYNRQQVSQPQFDAKLSLVTYAYPTYFKDLKYNLPAINRTDDNLDAHRDHERFIKQLDRRIPTTRVRNLRLAIFRQHWSKINLLNENRDWNNTRLDPDWLRAQQYQPDLYNAKLLQQQDPATTSDSAAVSFAPTPIDSTFKQTSFSDLTDAEFAAYLTNDFSLLEENQESAKFLATNFPIRPLTREFRDELAAELELRRLMQLGKFQQQQDGSNVLQRRPTWSLARQVIDELIGDVGLPIGPASFDNVPEQEQYRVFNEVKSYFGKNYQPQSGTGSRGPLTETDLIDEQQRRYDKFKENYGRIKAWFVKENWRIEESKLVKMMRLADMSWQDIKLTLFKICCLTKSNLEELSATNSSIRYLGSNDFMCQPLRHLDDDTSFTVNNPTGGGTSAARSQQQRQQQQLQSDNQSDLVALELYYYYSVHFNKHYGDMETFRRRFAIFRHNIDQIRWHSCTRGLTLFNALRLKSFEALNTIDVLDPRRSHTDDINLDRFKYFSIPDLSGSQNQQVDDSDQGFERLRADQRETDFTFASPNARLDGSRAGITYRREPFFTSVLEQNEGQPQYPRKQPDSYYNYADRRLVHDKDYTKSAQKYRQLGVQKVYDIVMLGYSECMRVTQGVDSRDLSPRPCIADGLLRDQATNGLLITSGQESSLYSRRQQLERLKDTCSIYWQGLSSWAEGLIRQDSLSAHLIAAARC